MKRFWPWALSASALAFSLGASLVGCGSDGITCTLIGCASSVELTLEDSSGNAFTTFSATVTVDGQNIVANCPNSAGATTHSCANGTLFLFSIAESQPGLQIEASEAGGASFSGSVSPMYVVDDEFNGPGCGSCTTGEATVRLQ